VHDLNGWEFAAFVGLVPRQSGTGGRVKLLGITKRGDVYLRTLLVWRSLGDHELQGTGGVAIKAVGPPAA